MNRHAYQATLSRLPIAQPTPEDMAALCPHLTPEQAVEAFTQGEHYVCVPGMYVHGCVHVIYYSQERQNLTHAFTQRLPESFVDGRACRAPSTTLGLTEALRFARDNWGDNLLIDDWQSFMQFNLEDPTRLSEHQDPCFVGTLWVAFSDTMSRLYEQYERPRSETFDAAIVHMATNEFHRRELMGPRGQSVSFNCAHCGGGLMSDRCHGCKKTFRKRESRCGWRTPLSPKMVTFLRDQGHVFGIDPTVAQTQERAEWLAAGG